MIFFNPQLMPTRAEATLYMVSNPKPFTRFEDHQAALYLQLHDLIERAMEEGDDPILLIEEYLGKVYTDGNIIDQIAAFLMEQDAMILALWTLQESWRNYDASLPENSLMYGGMDKKEAIQLYAEITLRTYLEVLSKQVE